MGYINRTLFVSCNPANLAKNKSLCCFFLSEEHDPSGKAMATSVQQSQKCVSLHFAKEYLEMNEYQGLTYTEHERLQPKPPH